MLHRNGDFLFYGLHSQIIASTHILQHLHKNVVDAWQKEEVPTEWWRIWGLPLNCATTREPPYPAHESPITYCLVYLLTTLVILRQKQLTVKWRK